MTVSIRPADLHGADRGPISAMLADYHAQTEGEKVAHGVAAPGELPERYAAEVRDAAASFAGADVIVADRDGEAIGMAVLHRAGADVEIKRLWVRHSIAEDRRDIPGLLATLADDCEYEMVPTGQRWRFTAMCDGGV